MPSPLTTAARPVDAFRRVAGSLSLKLVSRSLSTRLPALSACVFFMVLASLPRQSATGLISKVLCFFSGTLPSRSARVLRSPPMSAAPSLGLAGPPPRFAKGFFFWGAMPMAAMPVFAATARGFFFTSFGGGGGSSALVVATKTSTSRSATSATLTSSGARCDAAAPRSVTASQDVALASASSHALILTARPSSPSASTHATPSWTTDDRTSSSGSSSLDTTQGNASPGAFPAAQSAASSCAARRRRLALEERSWALASAERSRESSPGAAKTFDEDASSGGAAAASNAVRHADQTSPSTSAHARRAAARAFAYASSSSASSNASATRASAAGLVGSGVSAASSSKYEETAAAASDASESGELCARASLKAPRAARRSAGAAESRPAARGPAPHKIDVVAASHFVEQSAAAVASTERSALSRANRS